MTCALANLFMVRRHLLRCQGGSASATRPISGADISGGDRGPFAGLVILVGSAVIAGVFFAGQSIGLSERLPSSSDAGAVDIGARDH